MIITLILLVSLCTAWMLYQYHSYKRFVDDIETLNSTSTQSTNTSDTLTEPDNTSRTSELTKVELSSMEKPNFSESEKPDTELQKPTATIVEDAYEDFPESDSITEKIYEKREIHTEKRPLFLNDPRFQRLRNDPKNWLDGNPNVLVLTNNEISAELRGSINGIKVSFTDLNEEMREKIISDIRKISRMMREKEPVMPENPNYVVRQNEKIQQNQDGTLSIIHEATRTLIH